MTIRKAVVKVLTLQCTVVKGSIISIALSALMVLFSPAFLIVGIGIWVERHAPSTSSRLGRILNTPIRFPGLAVFEEANDKCNMNMKRIEHFFGVEKR